MRCPCLEHGGCPIEHLEQRVAALERRHGQIAELKLAVAQLAHDAGGPEPAAPVTAVSVREGFPQGTGFDSQRAGAQQQVTQQQRDSRAAPNRSCMTCMFEVDGSELVETPAGGWPCDTCQGSNWQPRPAPAYQDDYPPKQWDSEHMQPAPEQGQCVEPSYKQPGCDVLCGKCYYPPEQAAAPQPRPSLPRDPPPSYAWRCTCGTLNEKAWPDCSNCGAAQPRSRGGVE